MRAKSFAGMTCSVAGALEAIGDRWAVLLLRDLALGLSKYDELQASTGMPNTTLSTRLKHLESTGLVELVQVENPVAKHVDKRQPPRRQPGGEDQLAPRLQRRDGGALVLRRQRAVERQEPHARGQPAVEQGCGAADLGLAGQED